MAGRKKVEFRKRPLALDVSTVVVYATQPVGAVIGTFTLDGADIDTPAGLWSRHGHHGGIERPAYDAYFHNRSSAVALRVATAHRLRTPVPLAAVGASAAPQSFQYLPAAAIRGLHPGQVRSALATPSVLDLVSAAGALVARAARTMRASLAR